MQVAPRTAPRRNRPGGRRSANAMEVSWLRRPARISAHTAVVTNRHVIRGRKKNVPTVSRAMLVFPINGRSHRGTARAPRRLTQAMPALSTRLMTAETRRAWRRSQRRCSVGMSAHRSLISSTATERTSASRRSVPAHFRCGACHTDAVSPPSGPPRSPPPGR